MSSTGSGLDVGAIVDGLMGAQQGDLKRLNWEKNLYQNQQAAYTKLKSSLHQFTESLDNLQNVFSQHLYTIQSSNEAITSAITTSQYASPGTYNIQVNQLAQYNQIASGTFGSKNTALSISDELDITVGGQTLNLTINATDSLENIRDNINNTLNNPGVVASILKSTDPSGNDQYSLVLTSSDSGVANSITLGGAGVTDLNLNNQLCAAADAQFTLNGYNVTSSSNKVSDVIDGVIFNLNGQLGAATLTVSSDIDNEEAAITTAFTNFISSYNGLMDMLSKNSSLSQLRDNTFSVIQNNMQQLLTQSVGSGSVQTVYDLGVQTDIPQRLTNEEGVEYVVTGKIKVDYNQFNAMLNDNMADVQAFFTNNMNNYVDLVESGVRSIETNSILNRSVTLIQRTSYVSNQIGREEARLDEMRAVLTKRYAELDTYLEKYNQLSSYLEMQIDSMNSYRRK